MAARRAKKEHLAAAADQVNDFRRARGERERDLSGK